MNRASAVSLSLLVACFEDKPALSRWDACWVDGAAIVVDDVEGITSIESGADAVLDLDTSWGHRPAAVDSAFYATLWIELPASPAEDEVLSLADRPGRYFQQHIFGAEFESDALEGEARLVRSNDQTLTWDLDGEAVDPSLDLDGVGSIPFRGRVQAVRDGCG